MKSVPLVLLFSALIFVNLASAAECGRPISIEEVKALTGVVTLGQLKSRFGNWCQGQGPVSRYKGPEGMEIWFLWKKPYQIPSADVVITDQESMKYQVLLAFEVFNDDSGKQENIIWPSEFVGKNTKDVFIEDFGEQDFNEMDRIRRKVLGLDELEVLQKNFSDNPNFQDCIAIFNRVGHVLKQYKRSIEYGNRCLDLPHQPEADWLIHYWLADFYNKNNDVEHSILHLRLALKLNTKYTILKNSWISQDGLESIYAKIKH